MSGARFIRIVSLGKRMWLKQLEDGAIVADSDFTQAELFEPGDVAMIQSLARCVCGTAEIQLVDQDRMASLIATEAKTLEDRAAELRQKLALVRGHDS